MLSGCILDYLTKTMGIDRPSICLIGLGGTVSAHHADPLELCDYQSGHYELADILAKLPALNELATIYPYQLSNVSSTAISLCHWFNLKHLLEQQLTQPHIKGAVITHGTNTLEETAYFLQLTLTTDKPVILTGSQRPFSALSSDADFNLINSVRVAIADSAQGKGVLVVANDKIYSARDVSKTHSYHLETFQARNGGPLGSIDADRQVRFWQQPVQQPLAKPEFRQLTAPDNSPFVPIIYSHAGADQQVIEALLTHTALDGLVIAGTGAGRCSPLEEAAIAKARANHIPVVMSSRTGAGVVLPIACYQTLGLITLEHLSPQQARIWLILELLLKAQSGSLTVASSAASAD